MKRILVEPKLKEEVSKKLSTLSEASEYKIEEFKDFHEGDIFLLNDDVILNLHEDFHKNHDASVVALVENVDAMPASYLKFQADDVLSLPLHCADLLRVIRGHEMNLVLRSLEENYRSVPEMVKLLQEDLQLAGKIQRRLIREKFPSDPSLHIKSKYWCGLKSGGDYFDVFQFPDERKIGIILTDCSSYSLSNFLMTTLMQFSLHQSAESQDPAEIVTNLVRKMKENWKEKETLNIFYGILDKKTYQLKYVSAGNVFASVRKKGKVSWLAKGDTAAILGPNAPMPGSKEVDLEPGDRFILLSDGWADALGEGNVEIAEKFSIKFDDPQECINEMAFELHRKTTEEDLEPGELPMPPQDCSVLIFDFAKNLLRLAK